MYKPLNPAYEEHALFFNPAYMQMRLKGNEGPKHYLTPRGVSADLDGNVTFTMYAPEAQSVGVSGLGGSYGGEIVPLQKGEDGYWTATYANVLPGFHYCHFYVDGKPAMNPQAPFGYGGHEVENFFEVPDPNNDFYICKDVPHGSVHMELFPSSRTGAMHCCWVYTPASYYTDPERQYPVMFLHHGGGENETGWVWQGKINYIADNLIAAGECAEMIIVMACLYDINYDHPDEFVAGDFDALLTRDCIPMIESRYRVLPGCGSRAIAGLSMGSYHSAQVACNHPGMFGYVAMLSGSFDDRWYRWVNCRDVIAGNKTFQQQTRLFFMSVGTGETRLYPQMQENIAYLKANGITAGYFECEGLHEWTVWRKSIRAFMKQIFREDAQ